MTEWFHKRPGDDMNQFLDEEECTITIVNLSRPDWIRVPDETGHGGQYRCLEVKELACPLHGDSHICRHYILDGPVHVAECEVENRFLFYGKTHGESKTQTSSQS